MDSWLNDLDPDKNFFNEHDYTSNYYTISEFNTEFDDLLEGNHLIFNKNFLKQMENTLNKFWYHLNFRPALLFYPRQGTPEITKTSVT